MATAENPILNPLNTVPMLRVKMACNSLMNPACYVMLLYIRVSVVLIWSLCRKEREKLYIKLDSTVMLARV
jgi:hypothetical protein